MFINSLSILVRANDLVCILPELNLLLLLRSLGNPELFNLLLVDFIDDVIVGVASLSLPVFCFFPGLHLLAEVRLQFFVAGFPQFSCNIGLSLGHLESKPSRHRLSVLSDLVVLGFSLQKHIMSGCC